MSGNPFDFSSEAQATDQQLADSIAKLQALSNDDVEKLVPDPGDQQKIEQLIGAINAATTQNDKVAALRQNLASAGGALTKLFGVLKV